MNKLEDLYFKWLLKIICYDHREEHYSLVLRELFDREYVWSILYDENLAVWGLDLREEFYESSKTAQKLIDIHGEIDKNCSILEMMIALAVSCEEKIMTNGVENRTYFWFWEMIKSLGLKKYDDLHYNFDKVDEIIEKFLSRNYENNGKGGLFTVKNGDKNMRDVDVWMQMNAWLIENFD